MYPNRSVFKILIEGLQRTCTDWLVKDLFFWLGVGGVGGGSGKS